MIQIRWTKKKENLSSMEITGHAGSAACGQDLVCAGVSAIALSSLNALNELYPDACSLSAKGNRVFLKVLKNSPDLQCALRLLHAQLACMAEANPAFVRITTKQMPE